MQVHPLTRHNSKGETYRRSATVTSQIEAALEMSSETLLERAQISDSNSPHYLQEECLVYLIRDYFKKGQDNIVNKLSKILLRRSARFIYGKLQALDLDMVKDAYRDTINELWALIFNLITYILSI